jgi:putative toxin-antitoxin system antitoxin component (TIGR02293 family)
MTELESRPISEASRIARFMGLSRWRKMDDLDLVEQIRAGLPAATATTVAKRIDPDGRFVRATDIVPKSTLHRRKDSPLTKDESERVLALSKVFAEALRIYHDDADLVAQFMLKRHPMLGGRAPIELAKESIAGADLVLKLMTKADAGIAA